MQLSQLVDQHPTIVSHLVANAVRNIALTAIHDVLITGEVSEPMLERLNTTLERQDSSESYLTSLQSERPIGIELLSEMGMLALAHNGIGYLDVVDDEIENAKRESFQQEFAVETGYSAWLDGAIGKSLLPAFQQARTAVARTRSLIRSLRIISALESQSDTVPVPVTQDYLIEIGVPRKMTVDTMNGEPMKVKRENDRWIVYSVGTDLVDNGGSANLSEDFSLGAEPAN